jgi:hypothetical protein
MNMNWKCLKKNKRKYSNAREVKWWTKKLNNGELSFLYIVLILLGYVNQEAYEELNMQLWFEDIMPLYF